MSSAAARPESITSAAIPAGGRIREPQGDGASMLLVKQARLDRGSAAHAERSDPDGMLPAALRHQDDVADSDQVIGLLDGGAVDGDGSGRTEPRRERSALGKTRKPQPLVEAGLGAFSLCYRGDQAKFNSFNLAKGCPSRGNMRRRVLSEPLRRRGLPMKNSRSFSMIAR